MYPLQGSKEEARDPLRDDRRCQPFSLPESASAKINDGIVEGSADRSVPVPRIRPATSGSETAWVRHLARPTFSPLHLPDQDEALEEAWEPDADRGNRHRWLVPAAVTIGLAMITGFVGLSLFHFMPSHTSAAAPAPEVTSTEDLAARARAVAWAFASANAHDERLPLLRREEDGEAMRAHFEGLGNKEAEVAYLKSIGTRHTQGLTFHAFRLHFTDGHDRFVGVVEDPDGPRIDWKAYARQGSVSWEAFVNGSTEVAEMRAFARRGNYYNHTFADASVYQAYELSSPDWDRTLHAYASRQSLSGKILERMIASDSLQRVTLRLGPAGDTTPLQVPILDVLATSWIEVPRPAASDLQRSSTFPPYDDAIGLDTDFGTLDDISPMPLWSDGSENIDAKPTLDL